MNKGVVFLALILVVLLIGSQTVFIVDEREKAVKFELGVVVKTDFAPGLYWMVPFYHKVRKFDARIQTMDAEPERYLTSEKKNVLVDAFVKWKIHNVAKFYTATGGGDVSIANIRISQLIKDGLRGEFGKRTIKEVVSGERSEVMETLTVTANKQVQEFGIDIVDVRIKRIDLEANVSDSVYQRMNAERQRVAKDFRARGEEEAERIRADADRQRTILMAEAYRDAEKIRGEGDASAAKIYADSYNKDKEFYALYRSLNAYSKTFSNKNDLLVIQPDSEFFKYFK